MSIEASNKTDKEAKIIKIEENLGGIDFSIRFDERVNLLTGQSDTGKIFMLKTMTDYLMSVGVPVFSLTERRQVFLRKL